MRQAILVEPKHIEFKEVAEPKAADLTAHQVLVNIKRIGICGSEIHSYHWIEGGWVKTVVRVNLATADADALDVDENLMSS